MNDEIKKAEDILNKIGIKDFSIIKKINGGMSNHTFLIKIKDKKYILRIPAKNSSKYLKRKNEAIILNQIKNSPIAGDTIYFDVKSGIKITSYIEGESLNNIPNLNTNDLKEVLLTIKGLNLIKPAWKIEKENLCKKINRLQKSLSNFPKRYYDIKKSIFYLYKKYLKKEKNYLIHNDLQLSNIVESTDKKYYLIDFEYALKGAIYYEIASLYNDLNLNHLKDFDIVKLYFENDTDDLKYLKTYIAASLEITRWYLVARIKKNDNINLGVDFEGIANTFFSYLENLIERIKICAKERNFKFR